MKLIQRISEDEASTGNVHLANCVLMPPRSFLDHRDGPTNSAPRFIEAEKYHCIREIRNVDRRFHIANHSMLGDCYESRCA